MPQIPLQDVSAETEHLSYRNKQLTALGVHDGSTMLLKNQISTQVLITINNRTTVSVIRDGSTMLL